RYGEIAAKFFYEIDRDAGVHATLPVDQLGAVGKRHDRPMPDIWMDIEAPPAVTQEAHKALWPYIVARQGQRYDKGLALGGVEQLSAVRMIIGPPNQSLLPRFCCAAGRRFFRPGAPGEEIAVADRVVPRVQRFAAPPELENALGDSA